MKLGIIGFGNMGQSIAGGLVKALDSIEIAVVEKDPAKAGQAEKMDNIRLFEKADESFFSFSDYIVIAIKPQDLPELFVDISQYTREKEIISIAAGKSINYFQKNLKTEKIIRFMPNLAASIGKAVVGIAFSAQADTAFRNAAFTIAKALGTPVELPERSMSAITGLSGSGIAYVFQFIHSLAMGGVREGIPYEKALNIALGTVEGATEVLQQSGEHPAALLSKVTSPNGTTIEGITALEENAFTASVMQAVHRASKRADELEQ